MSRLRAESRILSLAKYLFAAILFSILSPEVCLALTPVARFDVVPYQRIEHAGTFKVGVVAFSKPGIASVQFNATGQGYSGGVKTVTAMTLNDQSGVWEYWTAFSATEFSGNGAITITAKVTDKGANTRELSLSMIVEGASAFAPVTAWVSTRGNNTTCTVNSESSPCLTVAGAITKIQAVNGGNANGAIIYLEEGTFSVASTSASTTNEWLTITKNDTAAVENVIINAGQLSTGYLKYDSVTLQSRGNGLYVANNNATRLWTNNCRRIGSGRSVINTNPVHHSSENHWSTNDYTYNADFAYRIAALVRGATVSTVGNDSFQNTRMVVNSTLDNISNGPNHAWHADGYQVFSTDPASSPPANNRIIYNVKVTDAHYQGIFMRSDVGTATDNAFVNVFLEMREPADINETGKPSFTALDVYHSWDHLILWNCTFITGHTAFSATLTNASFIGNVFYQYVDTKSEIGDPSLAYAKPGNTGNNEVLYNHFMYVYGVTGTCTPNSRFVNGNWPCPHWNAKKPDSDAAGSATTGGGVINIIDPKSSNFGAPVAGSVLVDRIPFVRVPVDLYGNPRTGNPDLGAIEIALSTGSQPPPPPISTPSGFEIN